MFDIELLKILFNFNANLPYVKKDKSKRKMGDF